MKLISVELGEAIDFIKYECDGDLARIFERLKFDQEHLYLVGRDYDEELNLKTIEREMNREQMEYVRRMRNELEERRES